MTDARAAEPTLLDSELVHGVIISNQSIRHSGDKTDKHGLDQKNTSDGSLNQNLISNVRYENFDRGFNIGFDNYTQINNGLAVNCDVGFSATSNGKAFGSVGIQDTPLMYRLSNGAFAPKVINYTPYQSADQPITMIDFVGGATTQGAGVKDWAASFSVNHSGGGGTETTPLFVLPTRMSGKMYILLRGATNFFCTILDMTWNGSTLTVTNNIPSHIGGMSGATVVESGGNLGIRFASSAAVNEAELFIDFTGYMYDR